MTFLEKHTDPTYPMHWRGDMQADYFYPNGVAGDRFFKHIMKHDSFLASTCPQCHKIFFPPRKYCEDCFCEIPEDAWKEIPATGRINVYTIATIDTYGEKLRNPRIIAMIAIDNTDCMFMGEIKMDDFKVDFNDMKVKAVFRPMREREGTLKDILYFRKQ
jgi:hypothetical protein